MSEQRTPIKIVYEDADIIACMKKPGIPSQPDPSGTKDMQSYVTEYLHSSQTGNCAGLVHRLDRDTGGLMLFGKNATATARLSAMMQDKSKMSKEYLAVISGDLQPDCGRMDDWLYLNRSAGKAFIADQTKDGAKKASLLYQTITAENDMKLVAVKLLTGRTHQIRAQFGGRGCPLCGDGKYGSRVRGMMSLWAFRISFPHPVSGKLIQLTDIPEPYGFFTSSLLRGIENNSVIFEEKNIEGGF